MEFIIRITGTTPLIIHNGRLANPLDPIVKEIKKYTGKRKKTDEDHEAIARLEHAGGLYMDPDAGPYIPGDNIHRALMDGGAKHKLKTRIKEAVLITTDVNPIMYKGPRDADGLWKDKKFVSLASVKIGTSRTMRCRPIFPEWRTEAEGLLDDTVMDLEDLRGCAETAGLLCGLGTWRPKHGRFAVELIGG